MGGKGSLSESMNQLKTKVFVEQPLALPGSANEDQLDWLYPPADWLNPLADWPNSPAD